MSSRADREVKAAERCLAQALSQRLAAAAVGEQVAIDPSDLIASALERLIPQLLRGEFAEWRGEGLDAIYVAVAWKLADRSCRMAGTCILISDQTVAPFGAELELAPDGETVANTQ
jgi:hypothetical protein